MQNRNDPARRGEAVECLLAGDIYGHTTSSLRAKVLASRFSLPPCRASLIAGLAWGFQHG